MGSVRFTPPVPHPTNKPVLEAKVDHLARKLDELHRGLGACSVCSTCSLHSGQRERMERQLESHSSMLDNLDKKMGKMQKTLDSLFKVLQQKAPPVCKGVVPLMDPPPSTQSLPARTSPVTTEDRHQDRREHTLLAPSKKETDTVKTLPHITKSLARTTVRENQVSTAPTKHTLNQWETNKCLDAKHTSQTPANKGMGAEQCDCARAGDQQTVKNQREVRDQPMAEDSQRVREKDGIKEESVQSKVLTQKTQIPGTVTDSQSTTPFEALHLTVSLPVRNSLSTKKPETQSELATNRQGDTKGDGTMSAVTVPAGESVGAPQKTTTARAAVTGVNAPWQPALAPWKPSGLAVHVETAESSSRQVHSCPEPLQRVQTGANSQSVCSVRAPAVGKTCHGQGGAGPGVACGMQIPLAADRTKFPPTTCHKIIDDAPPQPAPFLHRLVSLQSNPPSEAFVIHTTEILGSGRFGKVHKCTERSSGLMLAAKIINTRTAKEKERASNEVQAMNQLSHPNILQLYQAFESNHQLVLILEYVEGGELFDRIVDESSPLTEVDAMVFVKQICEGLSYMHQMYVLHLDLKPENILCVNRTGHQVKIIDFGLARRYRPREKLRVNFGTPEFLAPEVVDFDFVSFPTDMWTLGVVTYMLLSGLSPFLGDDDNQTLNNVLLANCSFDDEAFEHISAEAKDFISHLLVKDKGGRMSAAQCLRHPWLNNIAVKAKESNIVLKSQVLLKKYLAKKLWKKNYNAIAAANRLKKISSAGELATLDMDTVPISK
ncbi:myosin light chain kinase 2, skeletal/cardiac muscle isoform X2 [Esox lucius]|uniref:non-specific serine/threonine protein kinase n=1 Tax=Esox lucius TaxID=8010 RepID=A0A3P8XP48_ESOLU|nr:myosin light chain kinase 2, skeletal/cardiac muscle isoform X2 [Esox lucius]